MKLNFTPYFSKFNLDPAAHLFLGLAIVAVVITGFNDFGKQIASPTCSTQSDIDTMVLRKDSLASEVASLENQISENNNSIVSLQQSLVGTDTQIASITNSLQSDYVISVMKNKADTAYAIYNKYIASLNASRSQPTTGRRTLRTNTGDAQSATLYTTYTLELDKYRKALETNNANKLKLETLDSQRADLINSIATTDTRSEELNRTLGEVGNELQGINRSLEYAYGNICPSVENNCNDLLDNDGDGTIDCADGDCVGDFSCNVVVAQETICTDAMDNDGDGSTDCADADCAGNTSCNTNVVISGETSCTDAIDNDGDGSTDCADGDCAGDSSCIINVTVTSETSCADLMDNDNDGLTDCSDPDCSQYSACMINNNVGVTPVGGACTNNIECISGICSANICVSTVECVPSCGPGETCSAGACVDDGMGGQPRPIGNSCSKSSDCTSLNCSDGKCSSSILCNDETATNYKSTTESCNYISDSCQNGNAECSPSDSINHGTCTNECKLICDTGYGMTVSFWSAINPFGRDKYVCSGYVINNDYCGNSWGSCPRLDYPYNESATDDLGASERSRSWVCGTQRCTLD